MKRKRGWLQEEKISKNLTHDEVAKRVGIQRAYYTMIESGYRDPIVDVAKRISSVLAFEGLLFLKIMVT